MKTCPACREQIDEQATKCPNCGTRQMGTPRRLLNEFGTVVLLIVAAFVLAALFFPFWK